jgi:predicted DNA repair protein MutK
MEKKRVKGAVRTDFVLSAEIIVIAMSSLPPDTAFPVRAGVLALVGLLMTAGVYGFVAGVVKLDDLGFYLMSRPGSPPWGLKAGAVLVGAAPVLMRVLAIAGTAAMFLVGGGILCHGLSPLSGLVERLGRAFLPESLLEALAGLLAGLVLLALAQLGGKVLRMFRAGRA